ncbi:MAG: bifunctional folylpolyglutamate synthase/dihydrofolate synthase [Treponema sp.]|nr:bifunctional folylpolyglutamate synthase/dihydrofolate synthase [Treponema sp.]
MNEDTSLKFFTDWIDNYLNFEKTPKKNIFWLDTMKFLCEKLNHPENCYPCFHVAGSKGKGSISTMIAGILEEKGLRTGVYTSPHLLDFKERVGYVNKSFDFKVYKQSAEELISVIQSIPEEEFPSQRPVTWFELVTLFAMLCFKNAHVDFAVWEVGLGGRLDATNVVKPKCCCIGPIELEHTEYLGNTIEKIAREKGGIIKKSIPVVCAPQTEEAENILHNIAKSLEAPFIQADKNATLHELVYNIRQDFIHSKQNNIITNRPLISLDAKISSSFFKRDLKISLKMLSEVQAENAAIAALAVKQVFPDIDESIIEQGLSKISLPARFEIIDSMYYKDIPFIILDGAHTVNSINITIKTYNQISKSFYDSFHCYLQKPMLLFACAADKDVEDIASCLKNEYCNIILTRPGNQKMSDIKRAKAAFDNENIPCILEEDYEKAIKDILIAANKEKVPIMVTGSFYLVAEVKKYLRNLYL